MTNLSGFNFFFNKSISDNRQSYDDKTVAGKSKI